MLDNLVCDEIFLTSFNILQLKYQKTCQNMKVSFLADPTSPIPSHCASIVATSTLRINIDSYAVDMHGNMSDERSGRGHGALIINVGGA